MITIVAVFYFSFVLELFFFFRFHDKNISTVRREKKIEKEGKKEGNGNKKID